MKCIVNGILYYPDIDSSSDACNNVALNLSLENGNPVMLNKLI